MRTTTLTRSVVSAATLAVASATLVATPATAATPTGITRETVLTATNGLRAAYTSADDPSSATIKAIRSITHRGCAVDADNGELLLPGGNAVPTQAGSEADGIVVYGQIANVVDETTRNCVVAVVAATTPGYSLSGSSTLTVTTDPGGQVRTVTTPLSGDVTASAPISVAAPTAFAGLPTFTTSGAATKTTTVPAKTVKDKKTKAEKKTAKKKYAKKLKALKSSYAKALKKAGSSKTKKATAKKAYTAKKKVAKAAYRYAIADFRIVKKARTTQDVRPFSVGLLLL